MHPAAVRFGSSGSKRRTALLPADGFDNDPVMAAVANHGDGFSAASMNPQPRRPCSAEPIRRCRCDRTFLSKSLAWNEAADVFIKRCSAVRFSAVTAARWA
jgi:hypothetical protein